MNVLIVGSGGREHALAALFAQAPQTRALTVAPGNPGVDGLTLVAGGRALTATIAADDVAGQVALAQTIGADLVVVGPEAPLAAGLADALSKAGIAVFGPSAAAAQLEASKAFAKDAMARAGVPTAKAGLASSRAEAGDLLDALPGPFVIKADGLAGGKGVVIAATRQEADAAVDAMLAGQHGAASASVLIEEFMAGQEASVFAITDGTRFVLLPAAQDHKRAFDGDEGPNTGGMGAYAPAPAMTPALMDLVADTIVAPTLKTMADAGTPYRGVLYVGLMLTETGPKVVEFNARFGDPECQALVALSLAEDWPLAALLASAAGGHLDTSLAPPTPRHAAACVVLAAHGYPGTPQKGGVITGLEAASALEGVHVFHAGTRYGPNAALIASGGRVLNVVGVAPDLEAAVARAYAGVDAITWPDGFHRRDIAWRALKADV